MNATIKQWGNSAGIRLPKEAMAAGNLRLHDDLEIIPIDDGITLRKKRKKTFNDITKPLFDTASRKFDREEANER